MKKVFGKKLALALMLGEMVMGSGLSVALSWRRI